MDQAADTVPHLDASLVWQRLGEHVDRFAAAWQQAQSPPGLTDFLPQGPPQLRRLTLIELVKVDLENRWQNRRWPKLVEAYLTEFPEMGDVATVPCDLVYEEFHIRKQQQDDVSLSEYCRRFPARGEELKRLINMDAPTHSTAMTTGKKLPVFEVGQKIDDFELLGTLGKGAFATVFRARQTSMQRIVALKISRDHGFEPQTLAQLEHPHIVRVFDQRQVKEHKLRLLYMQYVPGGTLHSVLTYLRANPGAPRSGRMLLAAIDEALVKNGELPPSDSMTRYKLQNATWPQIICWLGARLAGALHHAHNQGVLHRDIKPANVLVGADAQPRLADFNISCSKLDGVTPAAYFGGTLAYMSPEQLEAYNPAHERMPGEIDARADIYSLGVLLWELLTLVRPFTDVAMPHDWAVALPAMTDLRRGGIQQSDKARIPSDCPRALVEVLLKCLEPEPDDRYQTAAELARDLDLCLQPRAHALLNVRGNLRSLARRHPVTTTILIGLIPNIVMSALNVLYNWSEIMRLLSEDEQRLFNLQIAVVNTTAYTIGLGYVFFTRGPMFRQVVRAVRGEKPDGTPDWPLWVRRALSLGLATAGISAILWSASGFIFPAWLRFGTGGLSVISRDQFLHFVVSNSLCGMISATQSYYVVTFLAVRLLYPWLLAGRPADARDLAALSDIARWGRIFLGVTVAVPFLALAALLTIDVGRVVIGAIAAIGFIGCAVGYMLDLAIRADLSALAAALNPSSDPLLAGDTVDSFLSSSRR